MANRNSEAHGTSDGLQAGGDYSADCRARRGHGTTYLLRPETRPSASSRYLQYGVLGQIHSTKFHNKWIVNRKGHEEELLTAPEISTLTDYASSYENVAKLQPFPLDMGTLIGLVIAIAIPMLPTVLAEIPFITVLKGLLAAVK